MCEKEQKTCHIYLSHSITWLVHYNDHILFAKMRKNNFPTSLKGNHGHSRLFEKIYVAI